MGGATTPATSAVALFQVYFLTSFSDCNVRQGLRVHYPSQTAAPSRGFPDFLLRAPAASVAQPESGSTTEISESEEEDNTAEGPPIAAEPVDPAPQSSPRLGASIQSTPLQEAGPSSECPLFNFMALIEYVW